MTNTKQNKYRIPLKSGQPGYFGMWQRCKHFGKPWDELTEAEKAEDLSKRGKEKPVKVAPKKATPPEPVKPPIPESHEDLFFLADALKMAADEMHDLNATLRKLIAEAERARGSPQA